MTPTDADALKNIAEASAFIAMQLLRITPVPEVSLAISHFGPRAECEVRSLTRALQRHERGQVRP